MGKSTKTKRFVRQLDQILHEDLGSEKRISQLTNQPLDEFKPGMGQHYCLACAKYFETDHALQHHYRGKVHKRRVKDIKKGPYTAEEADMAAGHNVNKYINKHQQQAGLNAEPLVQDVLKRHKPLEQVAKESEMELENDDNNEQQEQNETTNNEDPDKTVSQDIEVML